MSRDLAKTYIYHITDVSNLGGIVAGGGLLSDVAISQAGGPPTTIGYAHIKERRMTEYRVACTGNRLVGEFVPFYYCPRSPMLYTINRGNTGRPAGSQRSVVHLVSSVQVAINLGQPWAISDSNAGGNYAQFFDDPAKLDALNWNAINSQQWQNQTAAKAAEFLVADFYPWSAILAIGCQNAAIAAQVVELATLNPHQPKVLTKPDWYY